MNNKRIKEALMIVTVGVLSVGVTQSVSAGDRSQKDRKAVKSKTVEVAPAPLVDDSPINPVVIDSSDGTKKRDAASKQKKVERPKLRRKR